MNSSSDHSTEPTVKAESHATPMVGHTPGPWQVDLDNGGQVCAPAGKGYVTVCDPFDGRKDVDGKLLPIDERAANARLIASAPTLLELVERYEIWAQQVSEQRDVRVGIRNAGAMLANDLRAAIRNATGEPS